MSPPAPHLTLLFGALFLFAALSCSRLDDAPMAPAGKALAPPGPPTALTHVKSRYHPDIGGLLVTVRWKKPASGTRFYNEYDAEYQYSFGTAEGRWNTFKMAKSRNDSIYAHFTIDDPLRNTDVKWRVRTSTEAGQSAWVDTVFTISDNPYRIDDPSGNSFTRDKPKFPERLPLKTIWRATLTVAAPGGDLGDIGCFAKCGGRGNGHLTDRDFSYGPTYSIEAIQWERLANINYYRLKLTLVFEPGKSIPKNFPSYRTLVFTVGSREFVGADATLDAERENDDTLAWDLASDPLVGFELGERVQLSLKVRDHPTFDSDDPPIVPLTGDAPTPEPDLFPSQLDCHYPCEEHGGSVRSIHRDIQGGDQAFTRYMTETYGANWQTECDQTRCGSIRWADGTITDIE